MNYPDAVLVVVGGGPYQKTLEHYARKEAAENVYFTGMVPPSMVAKYYMLGDIFVCASTSEAQGLTYVEALASGRPMVCRKDDVLDGLVVDGRTGFQYTDFDSFASAVKTILNTEGLADEMSKNAKELAFSEYSTRAFATKVEAIYKREIEAFRRS